MLTVETSMSGHVPKPGDPDVLLITQALQVACAQELVGKGCGVESITFEEPWYEDETWKIRGKGKAD